MIVQHVEFLENLIGKTRLKIADKYHIRMAFLKAIIIVNIPPVLLQKEFRRDSGNVHKVEFILTNVISRPIKDWLPSQKFDTVIQKKYQKPWKRMIQELIVQQKRLGV